MCSEFSDSARRATSPEVRFGRGAQGISRSGPESGSDRDFVPLTLLGIRPGSARGAGRDAARLTMRSCDGYGAVSQGDHRANWPNPKESLFTDPRSLPSRMTEVDIALHVLAYPTSFFLGAEWEGRLGPPGDAQVPD